MECHFCKTNVKQWNEPCKAHLIVTKNSKDNHFHTHGELNNKDLMRELIDAATLEANIVKQDQKLDRKELVFHNRQRIGDILVMSCAIRDFHNAFPNIHINVTTTAMHIWDNNPYIDSTLTPTEENTIKIGPGKLTNASNRLDWHFTNAYRISIEDALNVHIPQGESRPDIWLTEDEYNAPRITKAAYWVIITSGEKGWGCKMYEFSKWQEFINQNQDKLFYQLGASEEHIPRLQGKNVVDYVGKTQDRNTGIRDLFKLFLNAEGSIGLVSFHMHLSGALYKPTIVIAGAREPVSFTRYQGQQYLSTEGCLPCAATTACWHCDINTCSDLIIKNEEKIPRCVDMIQPEDITRAINSYYVGGRLKLGVASNKPKLKNIVKGKSVSLVVPSSLQQEAKYGYTFGNTQITLDDWNFIKDTIKKYEIKRVLEFGSGLSTILLNEVAQVTSFETEEELIKKIKTINSNFDIKLWDGKELNLNERFDLAFVDAPYTGISREFSTKIASELTDRVIIHDAGRKEEKRWQEEYIKNKFEGPIKGGHRCSLWLKKTKQLAGIENRITPIQSGDSKFIKFVSTARGWGGAQRSVTTIMKLLLKDNHKVEFIPFRNKISSHEFQECIKNDLSNLIVIENYDTLKEHCDILVIYADDFLWEFDKPEIVDVFSDINADKKVMIVNYRRGKIGEIEWTKQFDKFMFLNSVQEKELLQVLPSTKTKALAPCTELEEFFKIQPNYDSNLRIVRHNSQGDTKFTKNFKNEIDEILNSRNDVEIHMLPGPSFMNETDRFKKYHRSSDKKVIADFLSKGNLFVYSLPQGYQDQGPKVIMEAMASGLAVIADAWGGAVDRVTTESGFLCSSKTEYAQIIKNITPQELRQKGEAARERAKKEFIPDNWIKEIVNDI